MTALKVLIHLTNAQQAYLLELGLSADAVQLYQLLLRHGTLTARQAVEHSGQFASAQYRLFYLLENFGLARRHGGRPLQFVAVPVATALPAALTVKRSQLQDLLTQSLGSTAGEVSTGNVRLLSGRQALYSEYARLAGQAKREICIYAIGIAYTEELVQTQRAAQKRGVRVRHAIQQLKPSNYYVIRAWRRLGVNVRLYPAERGFHVMLFDDAWALISFSDPLNTDDRLSLLTNNRQAIRLFQGYFNELWAEAREIAI